MTDLAPVLIWVQTVLRTALSADVGLGEAPAFTHTDPYPYFVVHQIDVTRWGPPLVNVDRNIDLLVQVDSVTGRADQCFVACDLARRVLLGRDPAGAYLIDHQAGLSDGGTISTREHESGPQPIDQQDETIYTLSERFTLRVVYPGGAG